MDRYVLAISWPRALQIYWAHAWRAFVVTVSVSIVAGVMLGLLGDRIGVARRGMLMIGFVMLFIAFVLYVGAWSMKRALQLDYSGFAVGVTSVDPASGAGVPTPATLTESHTLPVFWAMIWRGWLIAFPVNLLAAYLFKGTPLPVASTDWTTSFVLMLVQLAVSGAAGTWALRIALQLDYGRWRLQLVPN
jgi:hypothetical protein